MPRKGETTSIFASIFSRFFLLLNSLFFLEFSIENEVKLFCCDVGVLNERVPASTLPNEKSKSFTIPPEMIAVYREDNLGRFA